MTQIYLKSDVILLADIFEKIFKVFIKEFDNNPLYCVSLPRHTWLCVLKYTNNKFPILQDKNMILLLKKIRGRSITSVMGGR